jgi:hypothetical protein
MIPKTLTIDNVNGTDRGGLELVSGYLAAPLIEAFLKTICLGAVSPNLQVEGLSLQGAGTL